MRISGTYFERLVNIWLPLVSFMLCIFVIATRSLINPGVLFVLSSAAFFWLIDFLFLLSMALKPLIVTDVINIGKMRLLAKDIIRITPVSRRIGRANYKIIEFTFLSNGDTQKVSVMAKPVSFVGLCRGEKTKTLTLLFSSFPQLKRKLRADVTR